jgi:hypothetical protein
VGSSQSFFTPQDYGAVFYQHSGGTVRGHFVSLLFRFFAASSVAGMMASAAGGEAHSGQMTPALKTLYLDETVIHSPTDPAFAAYWSDKTDVIWWDSRQPVVRTSHFTDADGRRLVVTTIFAIPLCDISGCPIRIQTEQGEKLLDHVWACDLAEDHHLSVDGRTFIACDEKFPIPKTAAGASQFAKAPGTASDYVSEPPPKQQVYSEQREFSSAKDTLFAAYWSDKNIWWDAPPPAHHSISVGNFTDASGRKLIVTTIYDPGECGIQLCPIRIFTETGDMLLDTIACNANEFHRISSDRRYLMACGQALRIPEKAARVTEAAGHLAPAPALTSQLGVEKIAYDSGSELESPTAFVFHEYWSDKTGQIDWKAPVSERGMVYNTSLPSADGRALFLTTLQSSLGAVCKPRCQVRVLTAQHKTIMDFFACSDRTQHGISVDHRSFIACGESFAIPQVDDRTAIMENAPPDSNAEAYVEVVRRLRSKPANAPEPIHVDSAYHNNSEMLVSEWKDATVEITYNHPRPGLPVADGTLLFRGIRNGARYSGTAYTFKAGCPPAPYAVTGVKDQKKEVIVMTGAAPRRDPHSCAVIGDSAQSGPAKLVFDTKFYGDE